MPIQAELLSLSSIGTTNAKLENLAVLSTKGNLDRLNSQYLDLITTVDAIKKFTSKYPLLTDKGEQDLGKLFDKVFSTILVFHEIIANLDLRKGSSQFLKATDAYTYRNRAWNGHFKSEFDRLMKNKVSTSCINNLNYICLHLMLHIYGLWLLYDAAVKASNLGQKKHFLSSCLLTFLVYVKPRRPSAST